MAVNGLAADIRSLESIRTSAKDDPRAAVQAAAKQFEALFMQELLKSMRATTQGESLMGGGASEELATGMLDQQYATSLTGMPGGLAEALTRQLERSMGLTPGPIPVTIDRRANPMPAPSQNWTAAPAMSCARANGTPRRTSQSAMSVASEKPRGAAWAIALLSSLAVLFVGEVMGQAPCDLCWFQRAFMFPLAIILGLGLWWRDGSVGRYGIALALGGGVVALWHMGLYAGLIPERIQPCTATGPSCTDDNQLVFGIPIPLMALVAFALIGFLSALSLKETQT